MANETSDDSNAIAIVGMSGRFPGAANISELWTNLCGGVESIRPFTQEELQTGGVTAESLENPDYVNAGAPLDDADCFDAAFFGYLPREAELMDPQHRIFLECALSALEDAGYDPQQYAGDIGVFGGVARNTYFLQNAETYRQLMNSGATYDVTLGSDKDYAATRVAYQLNLNGPAMNIQTACSSSGVAVHMACQTLLNGECDMAMAGGARVQVPLTAGYLWVEGGIPSPDGHCRPFDENANGTVYGSGVAIVVLKRLEDALADGDNIYSVILGSAVNNDGSDKVGFTAPSIRGQTTVIESALAIAGTDVDSIGYVEAHGTGTSLGDPIEIAALTNAYRNYTQRKNYCAIGSLKSNIGHLDAGAGVAGLIKTSLMLYHKKLVPSLYYRRPNPEIDFAASPFFVSTEFCDWAVESGPRRAAISAFGLGGTNFHAVLEEAPQVHAEEKLDSWQVLFQSAKTGEALDRVSDDLAEYLSMDSDVDLGNAAYTLAVGRTAHPFRRVTVATTSENAADSLRSRETKTTRSSTASDTPKSVVFLFSGQGAQYVGMGKDLYEHEPVFRETFDRCCAYLEGHLEEDLREIVFVQSADAEDVSELLNQTRLTQPALFVTEYSLAMLWMSKGVVPDAVAGHSIGEIVAACVAGIFSVEDALRVIVARGQLMQDMPPGDMLAINLPEDKLRSRLPGEIEMAAVNTPALCVVSGTANNISSLQERLENDDVQSTLLRTSHAFHSKAMAPAVKPFQKVLSGVELKAPEIPLLSNVTGDWLTADQATDPAYWAGHILNTVRMADCIGKLLDEPARFIVEIGPGHTLCSFARQHPKRTKEHAVIQSLRHPTSGENDMAFFLLALGQLWCEGFELDWKKLYQSNKYRRVSLPTYPFERKRFWLKSQPTADAVNLATGIHMASDTIEKADTVPDVSSSPEYSRKDLISAALCSVLQELSGIPQEDLDVDESFVGMGFDSLFLTAANTKFKKICGVDISFRQLFDEAPTISALAEYVDGQLPEDSEKFRPPRVAPVAETIPDVVDTTPGAATDNSATDLRPSINRLSTDSGEYGDVFTRQLDVMQDQLDLIRSLQNAGTVTSAASSTVANQESDATYKTKFSQASITRDRPTSESKTRPVGPWKPIATGDFGQLTETQQEHLSSLIDRLVKKSGKSKAHTQSHRSHLADPRTVAGFRRIWKELVYPVVVDRSSGATVWDIDGNEYTDVAMGFGVGFLGHNHDCVIDAVREQLDKGVEIGPQHPLAGEVAKQICEFTGMERAAFCNTGSEAVLAAIRMARTVTGKDRIAVFSGDYHGIFDEVLARRVDGAAESRSVPIAPGIPGWSVDQTLVLEHGDSKSLDAIRDYADELAAVIVEPVQSRHPDLQPAEYLRELRKVTSELDIPLILDEIITGFRCHPGGIQALWNIEADIATYGKAIGGGFPIAVVAGKRKYMDALDGGHWQYGDDSFPETGVTWFAGTFVRHPVALAAANATLKYLKEKGPDLQKSLNEKTKRMVDELNDFLQSVSAPIRIETFASLFHIKFQDYQEVSSLLYAHLRDNNIHITEGRISFLSTAHTDEQISHFAEAFKASVTALQSGEFLPADGMVLQGRAIASSEKSSIVDKRQTTSWPKKVSMLEGQKEIWLAAAFSDDANRAYNLTNSIELRGQLDLDLLRSCIQTLVDRHEALRTHFNQDVIEQTIEEYVKVDVPICDLSALSSTAYDTEMAAVLAKASAFPFDLTRPPLFRPQIIKKADDHHIVLLTVHHIICDGWSTGVLMRELGKLYRQRIAGHDELPTPDHQLSDYVRLSRSDNFRDRQLRSREFWLDRLSGDLPALNLPTDHKRPRSRTFAAARVDYDLEPQFIADIQRMGRDQSCTLFTTLLSAYVVLLHRISHQDEFVIGVSAAQQATQDMRDLVCHCVSMLPIRIDIDPADSYAAFLQKIRRVVLDAFENQECTYGELLPDLNIDRTSGQPPLINTVFNLDPSMLNMEIGNLSCKISSIPRQFEIFDLFFNIVDTGTGARIECTYNVDLFDAGTISNRLDEFCKLLRSASNQPDTAISQLDILPDSESSVLSRSNATAREVPCGMRIDELITHHTFGKDLPAVEFDGTTITYGILEQRSNQLANYLRSLNIQPGNLVGIHMSRSAEMLVTILGVMKAGCAHLPMDPGFPAERLEYMLADSGTRVMITQSSLKDALPGFSGNVIYIECESDKIAACPASVPDIQSNPDSLAYVLYTSGSTGRPKGVMVPHRCVTNFLSSMATVPGLGADDVLVAVTTTSFDISVLELFLPLTVGAKVVIASSDDAADGVRLKSLLERSNATIMQATPTTWRMLLDAGWSGGDKFKALCGGEPLPQDLATDLIGACGELWNLYGPTETTIWSSCARITDADVPITIGRPIANTKVYILDQHQQLQPIGVSGELHIGGAGLSLGYINQPELTIETFIANPFSDDPDARLYRTGDLACWRSDGTIQHLGRIGGQVKIRGFRVELGEIESVLSGHDTVKTVACHVWQPEPGDQRLVACIVPNEGQTLMPTELRKHLRAKVPNYMVPQYFETVEAIPLTANGKIDRKALPLPAIGTSERHTFEPPKTETEKIIAAIWQDIIGVDTVARHDFFFEIGGHSLLAVRAAAEIEKQLKMRPNLRDIVLEDLAQIATHFSANLDEAPEPDEDKPTVLSRLFGR